MSKIDDVRRRLKKAYKRLGTWRRVADEFDLSAGMAYRIAQQGYEPKDLRIRARLGLESYGKAPVCSKCGVIHVSRRCTARPALWMKEIWETPRQELRWRLDNREEL